jgi:gamma-glutamyltranspeptidase/glutathione hydrolase
MPLQEAVAYPRIHVDTSGEHDKLAAEPGLDLPAVELPLKTYPEINMYFGGVGAASFHTDDGFDAAADPRRAGGVRIYHG